MPCAPGCGEMGVCHPNREDLLRSLYAKCEGAGGNYADALEDIMGELADAIWPPLQYASSKGGPQKAAPWPPGRSGDVEEGSR